MRLCHSIARVCRLIVTDPYDDSAGSSENTSFSLGDNLTIRLTLALGCPMVIEALWERLGLKKTLEDVAKASGAQIACERALLAIMTNRLCDPESKLGVWDRWLSTVHLPSCQELKLRQMYEAMDLLHSHAEQAEKTVFFQTADLFNLEVALIFYDTTTASYNVDAEKEPDRHPNATLRKSGHSKEGFWAPQVLVALVVTREGVPVRSWVLPCNTADVSTVEMMRSDLRGWSLGRAIFVADSSMNSDDNRTDLARACGKYLLACRMANVTEIKRDVLSKRGRYIILKDNLHAKEVIVGDGERRRRYILCYTKRQRKHRQMTTQLLEDELGRHRDRSATAQWAIELLASRRFKRYLRILKSGQVRIDRNAVREAETYDGKWVIETHDDTTSLQDAACGYKGLMVIERCFLSPKRTQIRMTPMYHWASRRIEAHMKILGLGLLIERIAELACGRTWHRIRGALEKIQLTEFFDLNHRVLMLNELPADTHKMLKLFKITLPRQVVHLEKQLPNP